MIHVRLCYSDKQKQSNLAMSKLVSLVLNKAKY
jgi:hypothetical protein